MPKKMMVLSFLSFADRKRKKLGSRDLKLMKQKKGGIRSCYIKQNVRRVCLPGSLEMAGGVKASSLSAILESAGTCVGGVQLPLKTRESVLNLLTFVFSICLTEQVNRKQEFGV